MAKAGEFRMPEGFKRLSFGPRSPYSLLLRQKQDEEEPSRKGLGLSAPDEASASEMKQAAVAV